MIDPYTSSGKVENIASAGDPEEAPLIRNALEPLQSEIGKLNS
jgi:hypothetical protein